MGKSTIFSALIWQKHGDIALRMQCGCNRVEAGFKMECCQNPNFPLGMCWLKKLKVMEGLPRKLISGNPRSTLCAFLGQGCEWVTFQHLKLEKSAPRLFHKDPLYIYVIMLSEVSYWSEEWFLSVLGIYVFMWSQMRSLCCVPAFLTLCLFLSLLVKTSVA